MSYPRVVTIEKYAELFNKKLFTFRDYLYPFHPNSFHN